MEDIRRKRPGLLTKGLGVLLLHDNARPQCCHNRESLELLELEKILPHPPYSPDLAA
jgi:hypothetical protein